MTTDTKHKHKKQKFVPDPLETTFPEQTQNSGGGDAYNGDDKHGPLEEEVTQTGPR